MGDGRGDFPGTAYTSPLMVVATLTGHSATDVFQWKRFITRRSWFIRLNAAGNQWDVTQRSRRIGEDDTGAAVFNDATPSALNKLYIYDNSALLPESGLPAGFNNGDFVYEEKDFTYQIQRQVGAVFVTLATLSVGQRIVARRAGATGTFATDWAGVDNSTAVRVLSATVSEAEVRAIVGGAIAINIAAGANT
jgi:hypothetical protein